MKPVWTKEAEALRAQGSPGTMAGGTAKAVLHVTVSPSGGDFFTKMHNVLTSAESEPHYLYDPVTDRLGQYFPLSQSARGLRTGAGRVSCNKFGSCVIQVEVVADADDPFTRHWRPGPNFRAMMRDIRANGVLDRFIARPARSYADAATLRVSYDAYEHWAGWLGHCHVPGQNDVAAGEKAQFGHWDPGPIDTTAFFKGAPHHGDGTEPRPHYVVKQGETLFRIAQRFHTTVAALVALNHIKNPNLIFPGQVLVLS
jgi:hypothetical protein